MIFRVEVTGEHVEGIEGQHRLHDLTSRYVSDLKSNGFIASRVFRTHDDVTTESPIPVFQPRQPEPIFEPEPIPVAVQPEIVVEPEKPTLLQRIFAKPQEPKWTADDPEIDEIVTQAESHGGALTVEFGSETAAALAREHGLVDADFVGVPAMSAKGYLSDEVKDIIRRKGS